MNVVLIIADDAALRRSLRAALPENDLALFEPTVDDALRRLIGIDVDVILVDDSPRTGQRAVKRLREAMPGIPVVVLVGREDKETFAGFALAGAATCLAKPFSCEELRAELDKALERQKESFVPRTETPSLAMHHHGSLNQHQMALRWLGRISGHITDSQRLSETLIDAVADIYDAVRCAVLLEQDGTVQVTASHGLPPSVTGDVRLGFGSGIMRWFERSPHLIERTGATPPDESKEMQILGARFAAPLMKGGRVCGALLVGEKASGREFTSEEQDLLTMVTRAASIALENTERYMEVAVQQDRLNAVLTNISSGVAVIAADKSVSMLNGSAERVLRVRAIDVMGKSVQKLGSGFADIALRSLTSGKPLMRQEVDDKSIGAKLGLSATPMADGGVVVIFSRIPEEQTPTEEIAYSPFWEYLASRVAQEIKNPLVAINTFSQLLPRKYDSEEFREAFSETVQKEVNRINSVVETLFDFARHPRLVLQQTNINETVTNALRSFEDELSARAIKLETNLDPRQPDANIDPIYFSQAMHNVVQNSIEAMPEGGTLRVETHMNERGCEVKISDTGPGVPEQDAPHIFMPFFSTKEQGMGLGLTLANRIAKQHEGDLKLVSDRQGSAAFSFTIPAARPQKVPSQKETSDANHSRSR